MKRAPLIVLLVWFGLLTPALKAQVNATNSTGVEPMYAYKGGLNETVNLWNGNLSLRLPLLALKGRAGQDVDFAVSHDSRQLRFYTDELGEHADWNYPGWTMGRWTTNFAPFVREWSELHPTDGRWRFHAEFTLEDGARHHVQTDYCGCQFFKGTGYSTNSMDMSYDFDRRILRMKNGVWYDFNAGRKGDANGNYFAFEVFTNGKPSAVTDNLGRRYSFAYTNTTFPDVPTRMSYFNGSQTLTYSFQYDSMPVDVTNPIFGNYVGDIPAGYYPFLTQITLPDGASWFFDYWIRRNVVGNPISTTTSIQRVTYPTGGVTNYSYAGDNLYLSRELRQKTTDARNGQPALTTSFQDGLSYPEGRITEPDGSYQTVQFRGDAPGIEASRRFYSSANTLLRTVSYTWTGSGGENYRVTRAQVYDAGVSLLSETNYQYDGAGNITQEETLGPYEPGQSFRGRRVTRTFLSLPNYISRVQDEIVYDLDQGLATSLVSQTRYSYDQFALTDRGSVTGHLDSYGVGYTARGNVTTVSRWLASEARWMNTTSTYDTLGNVVRTTDPRGRSTTINYSSTFHYAYPTQVINPKTHTVNTNYSFYTGQVTGATDPNNATTTTTYDSFNRVSRIDHPDGSYQRFTYDLTANNFSTTVYQSVTTLQEASATTYLDGLGRQKQKRTSDPAGDIYVDTVYSICDCTGKVAKVSNPYRVGETKYWTETQYDGLGRPTKIIPPDGSPTSNHALFTYSLSTTTVTDPAGKKKKYEYDVLGRIRKVFEPDSAGQLTWETSYNYLPTLGQNKLAITQGVQTRTFNYDSLGRLTSETHPENGTTSYSYDDNGNLAQRADARSWSTTYVYDEIDRLTSKTYANDGGVTPPVTLTYDTATNGVGRLATWSVGTSNSGSRNYDSMGRATSEQRTIQGQTATAQWSYNLAGQVTTTTFPNGATSTRGYDGVGNPETITASFYGTLVSNVDRDSSGQWSLVTYGNGVNSQRFYSPVTKQLERFTVVNPTTPATFLDQNYTYFSGNNGRVASATDNLDTTKNVSYSYDELNRLSAASTSGTHWGLAWSYDRYGNRLSQTVTKGSAPGGTLPIDAGTNRVSTWTYDAVGNVSHDGARGYQYDAENRLVSITGTASYVYDAFGERVSKETGGVLTRYFSGLAEMDNGVWVRLTVATPAGMVEWTNYGTRRTIFKHTDYLGNIRVITNGSGGLRGKTAFYPYGEVWSQTGTADKYKLTGKERDAESGNDYFGARYYANASGRWLSADPVLNDIYHPQRLNRYRYCLNDPINYVDPDGAEEKPPVFKVQVWGPDLNFFMRMTLSAFQKVPPVTAKQEKESFDLIRLPSTFEVNARWITAVFPCNKEGLLAAIQQDFPRFANHQASVGPFGLIWATITFMPNGPIALGDVIPIKATATFFVPQDMEVQVVQMDSSGFTFLTRPGHIFKGTISFRAEEKEGGVRFSIHALGNHRDEFTRNIAFPLFVKEFEDKTWKNFLGNVRKECESQK